MLITFADDAGKLEQTKTTLEHPFHVAARGFVAAAKLRVGMQVSRWQREWQPKAAPLQTIGFRAAEAATGHLLVKAISITRSGLNPWRAYNLTVEGDHTFFVGKARAWVHNACPKVFKKIKYNGRNDEDVLADLNAATKNRPAGGQWVLSGEARHGPGSAYEYLVTGVPNAYAFKVNGVKFDGVRNGTLLDAKNWSKWPLPDKDWSAASVVSPARRQIGVAGEAPIEWIIRSDAARSATRQVLERAGLSNRINLR